MEVKERRSGPLKVGVVGLGWVARERHIPAFRKDPRVKLHAFMDPDRSKADSLAASQKVPMSFTALDDFLAAPLDIVSVCTPPDTHAAIIQAALNAGKHVFVEKPMTMTAGEGRDLETLASEKGVTLCPAHNFLFSRSMMRARALLGRGDLGKVQWVSATQLSSWRRRLPSWYQSLPGGLFFDEAPHILYLMRFFLGELKVEHSWRSLDSSFSPNPSERHEVRFKGQQAGGSLSVWFGAPVSEWLLTVYGSKGVLVIDLFRDISIFLPPEKAHNSSDVLGAGWTATREYWAGVASSGLGYITDRLYYGHDVLVRRLIDSLIDGGDPPVSAADGWKVIGLIEEILSGASS